MSLVDPSEFDKARMVMYDEVKEVVGEDELQSTLEDLVVAQLENLYDNKEDIKQAMEEDESGDLEIDTE